MGTNTFIRFEARSKFVSPWDSIDGLCMSKKELLGVVQQCRNRWDEIPWNQETDVKEEAIDSKDGEAQAEYIHEAHLKL
jgi:hypothetical protein